MDNNFKCAMKLMRATKEYKTLFGWHPVCFWIYIGSAMLTGGGYLVDRLVGETSTIGEQFSFSIFPAVFFLFFGSYFGNQGTTIFSAGKSLLSFPMAKYMLTKGLVVSRLMSLVIGILPAVGMRLVCVTMGLCEVSMLDDMLICFGVAYVLAMIMSGYSGISSILLFSFGMLAFAMAVAKDVFGGTLKTVAEAAVVYVMPWWLVAIVFVGLVVFGTWLGLVVLEHTYKKRKAANSAMTLQTMQQ